MEKQMFRTFVKWDFATANVLTVGRIAGIMDVICEPDRLLKVRRTFAMMGHEDGVILTTECLKEHYDLFTRVIEYRYPDMCIFNYEME